MISPSRPHARRHARRHGFSFVELLFAMAVLSIGMLGVAAAVYVGIDQTRSTVDETTAAAVARQAVATLGQVMTKENATETNGDVQTFVPQTPSTQPTLQDAVAGSQISASDPRFAWMAVYRRINDTPAAVVFVFVVRSEARSAFDASDLVDADAAGPFPASLVPDNATVNVVDNQVTIRLPTGIERVGPNTLLVLHGTANPKLNGRVLRISGPGDGGAWALAPGQDAADFPSAITGQAFVIGRGYADPTRPQNGFAGISQAVAVYASVVLLR